MAKMYGPSFDGSGTLVNREVPESEVSVYEAAGYKRGELPAELESEPEPETEPDKPKSKTRVSKK